MAATCVWVVGQRRTFPPPPKWSRSVLERRLFSSRPGARCLIFPQQRSNMAGKTSVSQKRGRLWPQEYGWKSWYFSCCSDMLLARSSYNWKTKKSQQKSEEFLQGALFFFQRVLSHPFTSSHRAPTSPLLQDFHTDTLKWCELFFHWT